MHPIAVPPTDVQMRAADLVGAVITRELRIGKARFRKGQRIAVEDLPVLAGSDLPIHAVALGEDDVHEDDAAVRLAELVHGDGIMQRRPGPEPGEPRLDAQGPAPGRHGRAAEAEHATGPRHLHRAEPSAGRGREDRRGGEDRAGGDRPRGARRRGVRDRGASAADRRSPAVPADGRRGRRDGGQDRSPAGAVRGIRSAEGRLVWRQYPAVRVCRGRRR